MSRKRSKTHCKNTLKYEERKLNNLTLSSFLKPGVSGDARLYIAKENTNNAYVAPEKFSSKVLTWLGKMPLFEDTEVVQKHTENIRVQDQKILQAFLQALTEKYGEKAVNDALLMFQINMNKPLTQRLVEQITTCVKTADEGFINLVNNRGNVGIMNAALVIKGGETKVTEQNSDVGAEMKQHLLDIALNGLKRTIPQLEAVDGNSLRQDFQEMASGNGPLRSLMTNLHNLASIPEAKQLNDYVTTLKNIQIGAGRFLQWGTCGGEVERWVDKASTHELTQAVKKIHAIAKELKNVTTELENIKAGASMPQTLSGPTLGLARFAVSSIPINQQTQVKLNDGMPVPVNTLTFDGKPVALAGSYPKDTVDALEAHMKMLLEKECSCLVVLTPEEQIQASQLPAYFRGNHTFGEVHTNSQKVSSASQGGAIDQYNMQLSWGEKQYTIPVLHVKNWPDHQPLPSADQLEYLADSVKSSNQNGAPGRSSSDKHLPMIHCLGGVGRTGTLAAALVLKDNPHRNLEQIRADFRDSRNNRMLEDASQFVQLKAMQAQLLMTTAS
ncbi:TPA_asm: SPI-1 type III secretion system effector GTPase-activating protein SptP [Salmonella enterica subsp. salamae serovar 60:g,m,t:z6]|uniref:protein-tyrosine-phosphatase n=1 Tax=Salmonella enterica subsp. houtenae serovar 1,40:z4,z32:- TaxID=1967604 RepID=A0A730ZP14_SALHO|nr:SPI-1 type III secretion system effector GTPase-activating protein SptP [Salmonella enterica]HAC6699504.1 type III secretion system effector GTPase-activating protein SptP [Salmonella bongori serovar 66:z65:-]HAE2268278.1 SPI-1 type III secretion system effector GTPase-activating protein SptP [Salmonella enterica subsp. enterica serovar 1,9,12:-:-]HAE4189758.1 SPI-1 type III secretion system effector GTPase-activating protein SptP [Salmonella enterica subsp. houtenae serovar 1,40:z4,z32:-]HA